MKFFNTNAQSKSSIKDVISNKFLPRMIVILFSLAIILLLAINILIKKNMINTIKSAPKENTRYLKPLQISKFSNTNKESLNFEVSNNSTTINSNYKNLVSENEQKKITLSPKLTELFRNNSINYYNQLKKITKNIIFEKNITLTPIYLFDKQLPFYKRVTIDESPLLSFMSQLEIFYSISMLILIIIIISTLTIALLYRPVINLFASLDIMSLFTKNKIKNNLTEEIDISSDDTTTKSF